ncbi:MAG: hypothetical protein LBD97_08295, partial [Bifidobacteriaceae bacterium]|nr:hypothetical protein [Bifidobacteriaceae bacterium]
MENSVPAAITLIAVVTVSLGYLLPHLSRRRLSDAELPVEDRFSVRARLIERPTETTPTERSSTALLAGTRVQRTGIMQRPATSQPIKPARPIPPRQASRQALGKEPSGARKAPRVRDAAPAAAAGGPAGDARSAAPTPHHGATALPPRLVQARAQAARVRASLVAAFTLLTVIGLALALTVGMTFWAPAVCAALAGGTLVASHRAVLAEQRSDARMAGRAAPPSDPSGPPRGAHRPVQRSDQAEPTAPTAASAPAGGAARSGRRPAAVAPSLKQRSYRLPQPLEIKAVEVAELSAGAAGARRFTTSRPLPVHDHASPLSADLSSSDRSPAVGPESARADGALGAAES